MGWHGPFLFSLSVFVSCSLHAESLRAKSNKELLQIMLGSERIHEYEEQEAKQNAQLPAGFWEMAPADAALALVESRRPEILSTKLQINIPNARALQPPTGGEIGLRSSSSCETVEPREELTVLQYANGVGSLAFSSVAIDGDASDEEIAAAVKQTRLLELQPEIARHLYETLWWLGRVKIGSRSEEISDSGEAATERVISTADERGKFWNSPDLLPTEVRLFSYDFANRLGNGATNDVYASFADLVFREAVERAGIDKERPTARIGRERPLRDDEKFVRVHKLPGSSDAKEVSQWLDLMIAKLTDPQRETWAFDLISALVPLQEPIRYRDSRIDDALMSLVARAAEPTRNDARPKYNVVSDGGKAAEALAWRGHSAAFPMILNFLRTREYDVANDNGFIGAATLLATTREEYRPDLSSYLRDRLQETLRKKHHPHALLDAIWRGEFHEFRKQIEKISTASADEAENEPEKNARGTEPSGKYQEARRVTLAWSETDSLTKLKLNAIIEASSTHLFYCVPFFRRDFEALSPNEQSAFLDFVRWLSQQKIWTNWRTSNIEEEFGLKEKERED